MNFLIVTGLSGAGKSMAVNALEDIGFFCIDNIPVALLPRIVDFALQGKDILLALFFLLYALICILILLLRTSRHRKSVQFTCVFNTQSTTFSGVHFCLPEIVVF